MTSGVVISDFFSHNTTIMTVYKLIQVQKLPISLDVAWAFFSNPANLEQITPKWLNFKITSDLPKEMYPGMIATYNIKFYGVIPLNWVTEITQVQAPHYFVDEQRFGPYAFWHHQHHFKEIEGGVEATDIVHYKLPFAFMGTWARELMVRHQLNEIFVYREKMLNDFFGHST